MQNLYSFLVIYTKGKEITNLQRAEYSHLKYYSILTVKQYREMFSSWNFLWLVESKIIIQLYPLPSEINWDTYLLVVYSVAQL